MLLVRFLCLCGFGTQLAADYFLGVPPEKSDPVPVQFTGRATFLTTQTNVICTLYFAVAVADSLLGGSFDAVIRSLFPLVFGLGAFLSLAYYGLNHFNPVNVRKRAWWTKNGYPHVELASHLAHSLALPLVLLHAATIGQPVVDQSPGLVYTAVYIFMYCGFTVVSRAFSGAWVYPILDDVSKAGGCLGVLAFLVVLGGIATLLSYCGICLVFLVSPSPL